MRGGVFALLVAAVLCGLGGSGRAEGYKLGDLEVSRPWARASVGALKSGAAYVTLVNRGAQVDRLLAVATPAAERAQLHTHMMADGIMKMRHLEAVEVAPGEPTVFQPGGLHIMLVGLKAPLVEGESFPLTLTFEKAGAIEVNVKIHSVTTIAPPEGGESQDEHGDHSM